jgi:ATP-dependent DNA helicase DinG
MSCFFMPEKTKPVNTATIRIMENINERFSMPVIIKMRRQIERSDGNEVFFTGSVNSKGMVTSVTAAARGNESAVPLNRNEAGKSSVLIHNHPGGNLHPSDADLAVAAAASERAQGFYIINNDVTQVYAVMEPVLAVKLEPLDVGKVSYYLSSEGPLSVQSELYEERPVQISLMQNIAAAFNKNAIGVFEAGTGVGKSYAYLIPAMLWALQNKQRVVISTGTINLQQQLTEKDIPATEKIIGKTVKAVLVKGRQNYICLRRLEAAGNDRDLFSDETEIFDRIAEWAKTSRTGSKSELPFLPPENVWSRVKSESDACMGMRCPFREKCFVMQIRKEAADAQILVVNHHLLFADIESRMNGVGYDDPAVLPSYRRIIFDEAHGIESAATSFFSENFTRFKIQQQLNLLYRKRRNSASGYIFTLELLSQSSIDSVAVIAAIEAVKLSVINLETASLDLLGDNYSLRLYDQTSRSFGPVISLLSAVGESLGSLSGLLRDMLEEVPEDDKDTPAVWEVRSVLRRLDAAVLLCKNFTVWNEKPDTVFWMQKQRLSPDMAKNVKNPVYVIYTQTPLDIAPLMNTGVFEPMESVVCTSATLEIGRSFEYWMRRTGISFIDRERILQGEYVSPFPYKTNMLFAVTKDAPFPDSADFSAYVNKAVGRLIASSEGRALVLFTSYESLRRTYEAVKISSAGSGITFLKQGDDDRFRLLDTFKKDTTSVLFATDSFWQGIDVPGAALSQVIIVKLPFSVPNDPVFAARSESVAKRGGSPFMELSLPDAVIKFRQGIGRLIRRGDDRGVVVVLDRRIIEKQYGRIFLNSIPETKKLYASFSDISDDVAEFLVQ